MPNQNRKYTIKSVEVMSSGETVLGIEHQYEYADEDRTCTNNFTFPNGPIGIRDLAGQLLETANALDGGNVVEVVKGFGEEVKE
jgi:hypothetical protein